MQSFISRNTSNAQLNATQVFSVIFYWLRALRCRFCVIESIRKGCDVWKHFFFLFTWSNTSNLNWQNVRISSPFLSSSTFSIYQTSDNLSTMVSLKARLHDAILASMRVRLWHLPCQWFFRVCCFCCLLMKVALNTLAHQCQKVDFLREILRKPFKKRSFYIQVNIDWCDK